MCVYLKARYSPTVVFDKDASYYEDGVEVDEGSGQGIFSKRQVRANRSGRSKKRDKRAGTHDIYQNPTDASPCPCHSSHIPVGSSTEK
jgi:hypothetical protein